MRLIASNLLAITAPRGVPFAFTLRTAANWSPFLYPMMNPSPRSGPKGNSNSLVIAEVW